MRAGELTSALAPAHMSALTPARTSPTARTSPLTSPSARLSVLLGLGAGLGLSWAAVSFSALSFGGPGFGEVLALVALFTLSASAVAVTGAAQQLLAMLVLVLTGAPTPVARPYPELASQVGQSVPDAPGKPQPRAPGRALPVA